MNPFALDFSFTAYGPCGDCVDRLRRAQYDRDRFSGTIIFEMREVLFFDLYRLEIPSGI